MQSSFPFPQSACGVFHRYSDFRKLTSPQLPYRTVSTRSASLPSAWRVRSQAFTLLAAAPYQIATSLWTSGRNVHCIHFSMQLGCLAWEDIIHVSAHPVTPSLGTTSPTGTLPSASMIDRLMDQAVPATMSSFSKPSVSPVFRD